jgi:hypothetical protein
MIYTFICRRCDDLPVAACCRVMGVSPSGFYAWRARPVSDRDWDDAVLTNTIVDIHRASRCSYGSPRVHADLRLDQDLRCSRKRVERVDAPGEHPRHLPPQGSATRHSPPQREEPNRPPQGSNTLQSKVLEQRRSS